MAAFDVEHEFRLLNQRVATLEGYLKHTIDECKALRADLKKAGVDVGEGLAGHDEELDDHAFTLNELREQVDGTATKQDVVAATAGAIQAAEEVAQAITRAHTPSVTHIKILRDEKGRATGAIRHVTEWLGDKP
jgi:hypothetical protein